MFASRRILFLLLPSLLWLSGAVLIWWHLPMKGRVLASFNWPIQVLGVDESQALIVSQQDRIGAIGRKLGPVMLVDPETGDVLTSVLPTGAPILETRLDRGLVVGKHEESVQLASLGEGRILVNHAGSAETDAVETRLSSSTERFLIVEEHRVFVYDTLTGKLAWDFAPVLRAQFVGNGIVRTLALSRNDRSVRGRHTDLNAETGEVIDEDAPPLPSQQYDWIEDARSSDGSLRLLLQASPAGVYEIDTHRLVWEFDPALIAAFAPFSMGGSFRFSRDSEELLMLYRTGDSKLRLARWDARDGRVLVPMAAGGQAGGLIGGKAFAENDRWTAISDRQQRGTFMLPWSWRRPLSKIIDVGWLTRNRDPHVLVYENSEDRAIASVPLPETTSLAAVTETALFMTDQKDLFRYDLPPGPRLGWLLARGVLPAILLALILNRRAWRLFARS